MAQSPCLTNTPTISLATTANGVLTANANISATAGNGVKAKADGLYVQSPQVVSAFPSAPLDGDIAIISPAVGVKWMFQYSASAGVTNKWLFIGGGVLSARRNTTASFTSGVVGGSWYDASSIDQTTSVQVQLAGLYQVRWGANMRVQAGTADTLSVGVGVGGSPPVASLTTDWGSSVNANTAGIASSYQQSANANDSFKLYYSSTSGLAFLTYNRWLEVVPIRCS